jgi:hypothetical protein
MGRVPTALWVLILAAIALRVALWLAYRPAAIGATVDAIEYISMADGDMFGDPTRPAGYSMFLKLLHAVSADVDFTITVQHLLGIVTGVLMYATVARIGAPRLAALAAGAAVLLSLDQIYFEHVLQSEVLFTFGLAVVLYACVRALDEPREVLGRFTTRHAWVLTAGAALGGIAWIRATGAPLIPLLALWIAIAIPGRLRERVAHAALAGAAGIAVLVVYLSLNASATGSFALTQATGWALYGRVAPFADCTKFDPPAGTEELCEERPFTEFAGPDEYVYNESSPARRLFGAFPNGNAQLRDFALQAILHQPFEYALDVFNDVTRYFAPGYHVRHPVDYAYIEVSARDPGIEEAVGNTVVAYYEDESVVFHEDAVRVLTDLEQILRVHPIMLLQAVALSVLGIWWSSGRIRAGIVLLLGAGFLLLLIPSMTVTYVERYAVPSSGPLIGAGAMGLWVVIRHFTGGRREPVVHEPPGPA